MKMMPSSWHLFAKLAFSDRKPYLQSPACLISHLLCKKESKESLSWQCMARSKGCEKRSHWSDRLTQDELHPLFAPLQAQWWLLHPNSRLQAACQPFPPILWKPSFSFSFSFSVIDAAVGMVAKTEGQQLVTVAIVVRPRMPWIV